MNDDQHGKGYEGPQRTAPYPMSRLAPPYDLVRVAEEIQAADALISAVAGAELDAIAEQIRRLQAQAASVLEAAHREVREEVGIADLELEHDGLFDLDVHSIPARREALAHEHFDLRFLFRARSRTFAASAEVLGAKWCRLADIGGSGTDESVLRAVRKLQARLGTTTKTG